jgi:hypothetical protein
VAPDGAAVVEEDAGDEPVVGLPAAEVDDVVAPGALVDVVLAGAVDDVVLAGALVDVLELVVEGADVDGDEVDGVELVDGEAGFWVVVRSTTRTAVAVPPLTSASTRTSSPVDTLATPSRPATTTVSFDTA